MSWQHPEKAPVAFSDVAAYFSEEEWNLFHKWQKELYRNVMKDLHQALISLGPLIAASVFSLRAKGKEDLFPVDSRDYAREHSFNCSPSEMIESSDMIAGINEEDTQHRKHPLQTDQRESTDCVHTGGVDITPIVSFSIKEEADTYSMDHQDSERRESSSDPIVCCTGFPCLDTDTCLEKEEDPSASLMADPGAGEGESNTGPSSGHVVTTLVVSCHLKEEGENYSIDNPHCGRTENIGSPAGFSVLNTDISLRKEEESSANLTGPHCSEGGESIMGSSSGSGHRHRYKRGNKDVCTETFEPGETLTRKDKEKALQHSWKRGNGKRLIKSQSKIRNPEVNKPTQFADCERGANKSENSSEQQGTQTGTRISICSDVGKCFIQPSTLARHQKVHVEGKTYTCSECGKCFSDSPSLFKHQQIHTAVTPYTCSDCGMCFTQSSALIAHQVIHTEVTTCICSECGKCFRDSSTLFSHQQTHTRVKPYACGECGKCFTHSSALITHQRIHTGVKPYKCSECGKCFRHLSTLIRHQLIHTGVKPYKCNYCGKCFNQSSALIIHQRIHTGIKPYACSDCGKCFSDSSGLLKHQRIHTGVKPYKCSDCGKCFNQSSALTSHQRIHTGVKQ